MRAGSWITLWVLILQGSFSSGPAHAQAGALEVTVKAAPKHDSRDAGKVQIYARSKALVIGMNAYTEKGWPQLSGAIKDAEAVTEALKAQGFEVTLKRDLKSDDLDRVLKDFFVVDGADQEARLLLWFAGHGHTVNGEGYIVPTDAAGPENDATFRRKAISVRRFGEYMREANAKHVLAIFDSCFSGSVFNASRSSPPAAITLATVEPVRQFVSSGEAEQVVSDDGTFRKLFLDALSGKEPEADANGDGYVTGTELGLFLHNKITNLTGNKQTPRYGKLNALGYDRGDFVFEPVRSSPRPIPVAADAPARLSAAAEAWIHAKESQSMSDLEAFVRRFGDTYFGDLAKSRLDQLKGSVETQVPAQTPIKHVFTAPTVAQLPSGALAASKGNTPVQATHPMEWNEGMFTVNEMAILKSSARDSASTVVVLPSKYWPVEAIFEHDRPTDAKTEPKLAAGKGGPTPPSRMAARDWVRVKTSLNGRDVQGYLRVEEIQKKNVDIVNAIYDNYYKFQNDMKEKGAGGLVGYNGLYRQGNVTECLSPESRWKQEIDWLINNPPGAGWFFVWFDGKTFRHVQPLTNDFASRGAIASFALSGEILDKVERVFNGKEGNIKFYKLRDGNLIGLGNDLIALDPKFSGSNVRYIKWLKCSDDSSVKRWFEFSRRHVISKL